MSSDPGYEQLLDATLQHLEGLKAEGVRFVEVQSSVLADLLSAPAASPGSTTSPIARVATTTGASTSVPAAPIPVAKRESTPVSSGAPRENPAPAVNVVAVPPSQRSMVEEEVSFDEAEVAPAAPVVGVPAPAKEMSPEERGAAFEALRTRVLACVQCPHLVRSRKNVVFGVGDPRAALMFVGEAPGADEDVQGEPFVGAAGQLLDKIIGTMGLSRERVYIANVLKCRPDTPGQSYGNRKPTAEEMQTCFPYLREQIRLIQPKVIVALGGTAMEGLFGKSPIAISKIRGSWRSYEGIPLMPTYHPSYLLRTQETLTTRRQTWEDMLQVLDRLALPVTEKMRGYFLAPR